jgi:hypothetical protein
LKANNLRLGGEAYGKLTTSLDHEEANFFTKVGTMEPTSEFPVNDEEAEIPSTSRQATKTIFSSITTIALFVK